MYFDPTVLVLQPCNSFRQIHRPVVSTNDIRHSKQIPALVRVLYVSTLTIHHCMRYRTLLKQVWIILSKFIQTDNVLVLLHQPLLQFIKHQISRDCEINYRDVYSLDCISTSAYTCKSTHTFILGFYKNSWAASASTDK